MVGQRLRNAFWTWPSVLKGGFGITNHHCISWMDLWKLKLFKNSNNDAFHSVNVWSWAEKILVRLELFFVKFLEPMLRIANGHKIYEALRILPRLDLFSKKGTCFSSPMQCSRTSEPLNQSPYYCSMYNYVSIISYFCVISFLIKNHCMCMNHKTLTIAVQKPKFYINTMPQREYTKKSVQLEL